TGFAGTVYDIDIQPADGKILATGWFTTFNGTARAGIARLLTTGALDGTFTVGVGFGNVTPASLALTSSGSMVIVGSFGTYQGVTRKSIVRIGSTGLIDANFNAGLTESAEVVALQSSGKVIVGGGFRTYGNAQGTARIGVARLRSGTSTALFSAPFDFDGDGKTDISIFRPAPGEWWYQRSSDNVVPTFTFGTSTDKLVPGDYTGDGKTDIAYWQPSTVINWFVLRSEDFTFFAFPYGNSTDVPVPADYNGDGKTDAAVFRESAMTWYILRPDGGTDYIGFGKAGDKPVVSDYDSDGKADIAIFRPIGAIGAEWWIRRSSDGVVPAFTFGVATDKPVQGDYTGDGKADIAFWRPTTGEWFVLRSENFSFYSFPFGAVGSTPAPGDYDGDGRFDATVFHPPTATWFVNRTTAGVLIQG
ncbi:MAG TPA: FG-GAP-like repeat-containing protein, partial [Pyrinomonadaceae bacterium]|nr:FG-GAP-like repeat-containing protein [Pyrinomonadaceae bacterium]